MNQFDNQPAQADSAEGLFPGFPTLDVGKLAKLVVRRLWIAGFVFGVCIALAVAYLAFAKKVYQSTALINIEGTSGSSGAFAEFKGAKSTNSQTLDSLKSIATGLTNGSSILRVVEKLNLRNDPDFAGKSSASDAEIIREASKNITSELIRGERNIYLSVKDKDPVRAQKIAATLIDEFQLLLREQNAAAADRTRTMLEEQVNEQAQRVDETELSLQKFREQHLDIPLDESSETMTAKYRDLQNLANETRSKTAELRAEYDQYLALRSQPEKILDIGTHSSKTDSIQRLLLLRNQKVAEFRKIQSQYRPSHVTYRSHQDELDGLNEQVRAVALSLGESIEKQYLAAEQSALAAEAMVKTQAAKNIEIEDIRRQFRSLNRAREAALDTHDRLLESLNDSRVTRNVDETVIRIFSPPLVNKKPVNPKKTVTLALAGFLGAFLGIALIIVLGLLDRTLSTKKQVESTLGLTVLSEVPTDKKNKKLLIKDAVMAAQNSDSLIGEEFRRLRTSLSSLTPRSVMFTSAMEGEGKSYCAANLAVLQASLGYRTLLVDADFRNPELSRAFSTSGSSALNQCQETSINNLFLITMGQYMPDTGETMTGEHFAAMLWEAYSNFDCVIIDSSPICLVSDGLNYSRYADSIVLVVKSDHTKAGPAQDAIKELRRMRAPMSGIVLNSVAKINADRERYIRRAPAATPQITTQST